MRHVGGVSKFAHHALHHSDVTIQSASDATTIFIQKVKLIANVVPHLRINPSSVLDNPKQSIDRESPNIPSKRTGLRPIRSEVRLHCKMVSAWVAKKRDSYHGFGKVVTRKCYDKRNLRSAPHNTLYDQKKSISILLTCIKSLSPTNFPLIAASDVQLTDELYVTLKSDFDV